ncbi:MAG: hypothetical protein VYE73_07225 [Acidobacteriota bacterium]|nr:hypothetical protein [Acidobacteriota bacterium]
MDLESTVDELARRPPRPQAQPTVTLDRVAVREALDRVCGDSFLDWGLVRRASGSALKITPTVADIDSVVQQPDSPDR